MCAELVVAALNVAEFALIIRVAANIDHGAHFLLDPDCL